MAPRNWFRVSAVLLAVPLLLGLGFGFGVGSNAWQRPIGPPEVGGEIITIPVPTPEPSPAATSRTEVVPERKSGTDQTRVGTGAATGSDPADDNDTDPSDEHDDAPERKVPERHGAGVRPPTGGGPHHRGGSPTSSDGADDHDANPSDEHDDGDPDDGAASSGGSDDGD